ncbi:uncharacterized protein LOC133194263 [Saccostrea echinata]|uniref:uncharacterized protein LOC133194263 n=1 Tax=Saccostrea echinata TaxID=191078 RepID=UPI002A820149|nr:uncharacterized protein LOC133194263 [Saccostrea echinata]
MVPKVNKEIWRQMKKKGFSKKRDLRLMNIQSAITKSTCAILSVADSLLKIDGEKHDKDIRNCLDAIYLLGHANTTMSMQRRELLRPVLKSDYAGLCDSGTPVTSLLFGDDLPKSPKEARQMGNVGRIYLSKTEDDTDSIRNGRTNTSKRRSTTRNTKRLDTKESSSKEPYFECNTNTFAENGSGKSKGNISYAKLVHSTILCKSHEDVDSKATEIDIDDVTLKMLTLKTIMLLALLLGQRVQTLRALSINKLKLTEASAEFHIETFLKQSKPGQHLSVIKSHELP